jgi:hypothetical protein
VSSAYKPLNPALAVEKVWEFVTIVMPFDSIHMP